MADATAIIRLLGQQLAQAIVERTIAQVELAETQAALMQAQCDVADLKRATPDESEAAIAPEGHAGATEWIGPERGG